MSSTKEAAMKDIEQDNELMGEFKEQDYHKQINDQS